MPEETSADVVGREVRKISDSSSALEVKTKDGVSCPLDIPLNILMERGVLDIVVYRFRTHKRLTALRLLLTE